MSERKTSSHLKLVERTLDGEMCSVSIIETGTQSELFPMAKPSLLIFADVTNITGESFVSLVSQAKPSLVLDLRPTPRFDFNRLTRKTTFEVFRDNGSTYIDVTGMVGVSSKWDANLNPCHMVKSLNQIVQTKFHSVTGPLLLLFDDRNLLSSSIQVFANGLMNGERKKWEVCLYPSTL